LQFGAGKAGIQLAKIPLGGCVCHINSLL
jgi:hypothetical protein